jgi:hypothetical protein
MRLGGRRRRGGRIRRRPWRPRRARRLPFPPGSGPGGAAHLQRSRRWRRGAQLPRGGARRGMAAPMEEEAARLPRLLCRARIDHRGGGGGGGRGTGAAVPAAAPARPNRASGVARGGGARPCPSGASWGLVAR